MMTMIISRMTNKSACSLLCSKISTFKYNTFSKISAFVSTHFCKIWRDVFNILSARRKLACRWLCGENSWSKVRRRKRTSDRDSVPVHGLARPRYSRRYWRHPHHDSQDEGNPGSWKKLCPRYSPLQVLLKCWDII